MVCWCSNDAIFYVSGRFAGWRVGEDIVIASTNMREQSCTMSRQDSCETEEATIAAVDGATVTLTQPLRYTHYSVAEEIGGRVLEMRAEVWRLF